jgi:hypothetical protein
MDGGPTAALPMMRGSHRALDWAHGATQATSSNSPSLSFSRAAGFPIHQGIDEPIDLPADPLFLLLLVLSHRSRSPGRRLLSGGNRKGARGGQIDANDPELPLRVRCEMSLTEHPKLAILRSALACGEIECSSISGNAASSSRCSVARPAT